MPEPASPRLALVAPSGTDSASLGDDIIRAIVARLEAVVATQDELDAVENSKAPIASVARVGEMSPVVVRLGSLAGPTYRPVFYAPRPCRIDLVTFTPHTSIASSSFTWQVNFVRRGRDWLSTRYYDRVIARSPVRFWLFNDTGEPTIPDPLDPDAEFEMGETTVFEEETTAPDGLVVGAPTLQAAGPPVHQQTAIAFDGTGAQYARTIAADLVLGNAPQTWTWWVNPGRDVLTTAEQMHVMGADAATGTARPAAQPVLAILPSGGGAPTGGAPNGVAILDSAGNIVVQTAHYPGLRVGEWNLIQYVRNSATADTDLLYINGYQPTRLWPVDTAWVNESSRLVFGKSRSGGVPDYPFQGSIGPVAIYDQALTLDDHRKDYNSVFWRSSAAWTFTANEEVVYPTFLPDAEHREMDIGDVLWAEVVPLGGVALLEDMTVTVIASAI